jgi:hypothetical protein
MHWLLDVEFGDDLSRYRTGQAPKTWRDAGLITIDELDAGCLKRPP